MCVFSSIKFSLSLLLFSSVSAPGKALVAGGYLVLDKENIGLTIAVSSRFYTTIKSVVSSLGSI